MPSALQNFQKILRTFTPKEIVNLVDTLKSTYDTEIKTNTSSKHILKLEPLILMDEKEKYIPTNPRVKQGTKAKLYFGVDPFPTEVILIGGGTFGEIWQSSADKQLLFKRVIPNKNLSFENQARSFLCESWIQTILNSDANYGKYTSKILNLYRDESIIGTEVGGDIQISGEPIFFIQMEYIPYPFAPYVGSGIFKMQQMKGVLYTVASYLHHFYKQYSFFHRDFHCSNMMMSDEGIKIIDFGKACLKYNGVYYHMPSKESVPKELTDKFSGLFSSVKDCVSLDLALFLLSMMEIFDDSLKYVKDKKQEILVSLIQDMMQYIKYQQFEQDIEENTNYLKYLFVRNRAPKYQYIPDVYTMLKDYATVKSYRGSIFWLVYPEELKKLPKLILEDILETDAFYPQKLMTMLKEEYTPKTTVFERIIRRPAAAYTPSPEKNVLNTIQSIKTLGGSRRKQTRKHKQKQKHQTRKTTRKH